LPASAGGAAYFLPGYPGQSRTLADLYYNRYRDYDSSTGRYIQADPIGLGGDVNPYSYAENNPVTGIDPLGLRGTRSAPVRPAPPIIRGQGPRRSPAGMPVVILPITQPLDSDLKLCPVDERDYTSCRTASLSELRNMGINPHELKRDVLGNRASISKYDICICRLAGVIVIKLAPQGRCGKSRPWEYLDV
jgi:RHS repeat-associated protein